MERENKKKMLCANCGKPGHEYKYCTDAITSFGLVNIKILNDYSDSMRLLIKEKFCRKNSSFYMVSSKKYSNVKCYISDNIKLYEDNVDQYHLNTDHLPYTDEEQIKKFFYYKDKLLFMMVSRRFSLGFIEFMRGKYNISDTRSIIILFEQMTHEEIKLIHVSQYDDLLYVFLNRHNESKEIVLNRIYEGKYSSEYCEAKIKFNLLLNPNMDQTIDVPWNLHFYTSHIKPAWKKPEWGFPKGRRDKLSEENLTCACREFEEETGFKHNEYVVLNRIEPIEEKLVGTNGVPYKHVYYLSINDTDRDDNFKNYDIYEIGEIKWFTYEEAMTHIRPYHTEKKKILTKIYLFLLNYLINYKQESNIFFENT
jgi:8-oxo-dGTP pyrophosphatase MutT (NUDIX family)